MRNIERFHVRNQLQASSLAKQCLQKFGFTLKGVDSIGIGLFGCIRIKELDSNGFLISLVESFENQREVTGHFLLHSLIIVHAFLNHETILKRNIL